MPARHLFDLRRAGMRAQRRHLIDVMAIDFEPWFNGVKVLQAIERDRQDLGR